MRLHTTLSRPRDGGLSRVDARERSHDALIGRELTSGSDAEIADATNGQQNTTNGCPAE
jgi:hypothetical protein